MPIGKVGALVKRDKVTSSAIRSIAIALALLLHISLFFWLTFPPKPLEYTTRDTSNAQTLKVSFIKESTPKLARAPLTLRRSPSKQTPIAHVNTVAHVTRISRVPAAPLNQPSVSAANSLPAAPADTSQLDAFPYGNSHFEKALTRAQTEASMRLPGDDEPMKVAGIHVETAPSISQDLHAVGHVLRCKDALFKSRMTDQQLAQRGLTEQQMMLEFIEEGCH